MCHFTEILHGVEDPNSGSHVCRARLNCWPCHNVLERPQDISEWLGKSKTEQTGGHHRVTMTESSPI